MGTSSGSDGVAGAARRGDTGASSSVARGSCPLAFTPPKVRLPLAVHFASPFTISFTMPVLYYGRHAAAAISNKSYRFELPACIMHIIVSTSICDTASTP